MTELVEGLARAMHAGLDDFDPKVEPPPFEQLAGWTQEAMRRQARAALSHLGIPEGAKSVNVGEAVEALGKALPILECEEARHDILLKCTEVEGATKAEKRLREKHLRGKRREAYRAVKTVKEVLRALGVEVDS